MGWKEKLDVVRNVASGSWDAIRANDDNERDTCPRCKTYLGGGGGAVSDTCLFCGTKLKDE